MMDKHDIQYRSKNECEDEILRLSNNLTDKSNELADLKKEYARLSDFSTKELKRMSELIRVLETDNKSMMLDKQEAENQSRIKQEEIYTLLNQVRGL